MGIERRYGNTGARHAEPEQGLVGEVDDATQALGGEALRHLFQGDVGGHVADAHVAVGQHHDRPAHAGELRQHLGVARIVIAGLVERLLVERRGDDPADPLGLGEAHAALDGKVGEAAAIGRELARQDGVAFRTGLESAERRPFGILGLDLGDIEFGRELRPRPLQRNAAADHHELELPGLDPVPQPPRGLDDDLGSDPGRDRPS